jgi:hypothetical protein
VKMIWIVMSGGTSRARAFDSNAVNLADEAEANAVADRRNEAERAAGRSEDDVLWFATQAPDFKGMFS